MVLYLQKRALWVHKFHKLVFSDQVTFGQLGILAIKWCSLE